MSLLNLQRVECFNYSRILLSDERHPQLNRSVHYKWPRLVVDVSDRYFCISAMWVCVLFDLRAAISQK